MQKQKKRREFLSQIVEGTPIPTFVMDKNHEVVFWNKAIEKLTGIKAQEVVGSKEPWKAFYDEQKPVLADMIVDGEAEEKIAEYYDDYEESMIEGSYEVTRFFEDLAGEERWLYFVASPIKNRKNEIIGAIETLQDITKRKEADKKNELLYSLLKHDLKNKRQVVVGHLKLLKEMDLPDKAGEHLDKVIDSVRDSGEIIRDISTYRKLEEIELDEKNIKTILENSISEINDVAQISNFEIKTDLIDSEVVASDLSERMFTNILENSIRHSRGSEVRVRVKDKESEVIVTIEDDGVGLTQEEKSKIFERGFKDKDTGETGLGMFLVKKIVESQEGEIEAKDSELGGARFDIHLKKPS